jgi:hypothetical protein
MLMIQDKPLDGTQGAEMPAPVYCNDCTWLHRVQRCEISPVPPGTAVCLAEVVHKRPVSGTWLHKPYDIRTYADPQRKNAHNTCSDFLHYTYFHPGLL